MELMKKKIERKKQNIKFLKNMTHLIQFYVMSNCIIINHMLYADDMCIISLSSANTMYSTTRVQLHFMHGKMGTEKKGTGKKGTEKRAQEKWAQEKRAQVKN